MRHVYVALHVALEAVSKWGDAARNAADLVDPPRVVKVETYTPSPAECYRLLAVAISDPIGVLVNLAVYTGTRQGELLGLQWPDIDYSQTAMGST